VKATKYILRLLWCLLSLIGGHAAGRSTQSPYDGLNPSPPAGSPSGVGATAQQTVFHQYDAAGVMHMVRNAAGECTYSFVDVLGRPTLPSVYNSDSSAASNAGYWYSPDHQSVVTTAGTGANAIRTTTYTDTRGLPVLVRHADGTYEATQYDANGNKIGFLDEQGAVTIWTYDGLNHMATEMLPASSTENAALITYDYNAAGELLTRQMPGGLTAKSVYDTAGRKKQKELDGTNNAVTRQYNYSYYTSGANVGLLQTVSDPRGITFTNTYDDWLRPAAINATGSGAPQQNQNTTYGYDIRGMANSILQSYAASTTGPTTLVARSFDAYGQMNQETVSVGPQNALVVTSQWSQSWDNAGAGRR
jgi:YD repeat-containing protein